MPQPFNLKNYPISVALLAGLISGIALGLLLKLMEEVTQKKVYTLLLNVDYIPLLKEYKFSEVIEFSFHLLISVILSILLFLFLRQKNWAAKHNMYFVIIVSLIIAILLYPTTTFSQRTPALSDWAAIFYWLLAHLLYGSILGVLLRKA